MKRRNPVTQEWVMTLIVGYFICGPIVMLGVMSIVYFVKWILS